MLKLSVISSLVVILLLGLLVWLGALPPNILQWPPLLIAGAGELVTTNISLPVWLVMLGSLLIWFSAQQKPRGTNISRNVVANADDESQSKSGTETVTESITPPGGRAGEQLAVEIEPEPEAVDVRPQELGITDDEQRMLNLFMQTDEQFLQVNYLQRHLVVPVIRIEQILAALVEKQLLIASDGDSGGSSYCLSQLGSDFVLGRDFTVRN
jgi:hypothetical protein